jgi:hypothetical protein
MVDVHKKNVDHQDDGVENGRIRGSDDISIDHNDYSCDGGDLVGDNNSDYPNDTVAKKIATLETRFVMYLRLGLLLSLLVSAAVVSATVYIFISSQEEKKFETAFIEYSSKLAEAFQSIAGRRLGAIAALSTSVTSFALASNATWPFVIVPNFEAQVRHINELAGVNRTAFAVVVEAKNRAMWEQKYVPQNYLIWLEESRKINELFNPKSNATVPGQVGPPEGEVAEQGPSEVSYEGMPDFSKGYSSQIFDYIFNSEGQPRFVISKGIGPFLTWWQTAPIDGSDVDEGLVNADMNTDPTFNRDLIDRLSQRKAALGGMTLIGYGGVNDPTSGFYYPVLQDLREDSPLGGSLASLIYWLPFFSNILPQGAVGLIGVLENTCEQGFTFQLDGAAVKFKGEGDLHDPKYNYFHKEVSFTQLIKDSIANKRYLGLPLDELGCQYTLHIYASPEMKHEYTSNKPIIFTMVVLLIFLVTSLLFLLYDRLVERRQRLVQREAEKSGAIISSLFPAAYRDRLMANQATTQGTTKAQLADKGSKNSQARSTTRSCSVDGTFCQRMYSPNARSYHSFNR